MATLLIRELSSGYSLPIHQCASLKGDKWWSLSSFKEASLIWDFCGFVREIECPELFFGFPQLLRAGAPPLRGARASHCDGFFCEAQLSSCGSRALEHGLSSCGVWA